MSYLKSRFVIGTTLINLMIKFFNLDIKQNGDINNILEHLKIEQKKLNW